MENNLKAVVYGRLEAIAAAEKITRVELGALSREALLYVPDSNDIELVNRLLGVLTPMNRQTAILFFSHFLPWEIERDGNDAFQRFGKKMKSDKKVKRRMEIITEFLADEVNDIWTWAAVHVEIEKKEVNMMTEFSKALDLALKGVDSKTKHAEPLTKQQIIDVVLGKITADEMLACMTHAQDRVDEVTEGALDIEEKVDA